MSTNSIPTPSESEQDARKDILGSIANHVRTDAYARCVTKWKPDDKGVLKIKKDFYPVRVNGQTSPLVALEPEALGHHLASDGNTYRLGVYPVRSGHDVTRISVVDVDDHDGTLGWAELVQRAAKIKVELERVGLKPYPVKSGGGGGIHMWLLYDRPIPVARNHALLKRCVEAAGCVVKSGVVDLLPGKNPVDADRFGLCVSLPFSNLQPAWDVEHDCERPAGPIGVSAPIALPEVKVPDKNPVGAPPKWDSDKVRSALNWIESDEYDTWYKVLQALYRSGEGSDEAMEIAREWSARSSKYDEAGFDKFWSKLKVDAPAKGGVTLGTVLYMAKEAGWEYGGGQRSTASSTDKVQIYYDHVDLAAMVEQTHAAMRAIDPPAVLLYLNTLFKVVSGDDAMPEGVDTKLYPKDMPRTLSYDSRSVALRAVVGKYINFYSISKKGERYDIPVPAEPITSWLQQGEYPGLPRLSRLVFGPVLRSDGTLVDSMGYDKATGVYRVGDAEGWDDIEPATTPAELGRCLGTLYEPLRDFMFDEPYARTAVALAMLTGITRHLYGPAPGLKAEAATIDAGKTLLAQTVLAIVGGFFGVAPATMADETELRKFILSLARSGVPYLFIDNVKGVLGSETLEAVHTSGAVSGRLLGFSVDLHLDWRVLCIYTIQKGAAVSGDLERRNLSVRINPGVDNPGARPAESFVHPNLLDWLRGNWKSINMAALRLLRGYCATVPIAARPKRSGSWVDWAEWTENPMNWAIGVVAKAGLGAVKRQDGPLAEVKTVLAWGFEQWSASKVLSETLSKSRDGDRSVETTVLLELAHWLRQPEPRYAEKRTGGFTSRDLYDWINTPAGRAKSEKLVSLIWDQYKAEPKQTGEITKILKPICETVYGGLILRYEPPASHSAVAKYWLHEKDVSTGGWNPI